MVSECEGGLHPRARAGLILFNAGSYFEAHEELEAAWKAEPGAVRRLYQGILEAGVTYLHITRGNYAGALKVYDRSMKWLQGWPAECRGVNVEKLRQDLSATVQVVRGLGPDRIREFDRRSLQPVVWHEAAGA
jgi:predicted metal-dependent hydrolase